MIRTRPQEFIGNGEHRLAVSTEELTLIAGLLSMVKLGPSPYAQAAMKLYDTLENTSVGSYSNIVDEALQEIQPVLEVRDSNFDLLHVFDCDYIVEIVV